MLCLVPLSKSLIFYFINFCVSFETLKTFPKKRDTITTYRLFHKTVPWYGRKDLDYLWLFSKASIKQDETSITEPLVHWCGVLCILHMSDIFHSKSNHWLVWIRLWSQLTCTLIMSAISLHPRSLTKASWLHS